MPPGQLGYDYYAAGGKLRRRGRGQATHPHKLRPRKWSRWHYIRKPGQI